MLKNVLSNLFERCFSENENCWKQALSKLLEKRALKSLKKICEGIGVLPEGVLEMLHKNFTKRKSCFIPYFFKFRNNYFWENALSGYIVSSEIYTIKSLVSRVKYYKKLSRLNKCSTSTIKINYFAKCVQS